MDELRVAIVGVGDVATRDYLPEFHRLAGRARLQCVMSRTPERASAVASAYRVPRWTTSLEDALGGDIDLVVNLTPAHAHAEITLAALEAGKDVYSEKPVGVSSREVARIVAAERRTGRTVAAAPSVVLFPQHSAVGEVVSSGALGAVTAVRAQAGGGVPPWEGFTTDPSHFFAPDSGPWRDMGVYPLHAIVDLFGWVSSVTATSRRTVPSFTIRSGPLRGTEVPVLVDDDWHVTLTTVSGIIADIHANFSVRASIAPPFEVLGREGAVATDLLDSSAPLHRLDRGSTEWRRIRVPAERASGPDHLLGVANLVDYLRDGARLRIDTEVARHVVAVLEAAEESARDGRRQIVEVHREGVTNS